MSYPLKATEWHENGAIFKRQQLFLLPDKYKLSVIWGSSTYSDNYDHFGGSGRPFNEEPLKVEVGLITPGRGVGGNVAGYVHFERVIPWVESLRPGMDIRASWLATFIPGGPDWSLN